MTAKVKPNESITDFFDKAAFAVTAIRRNGEINYVNKSFSDTFGDRIPSIGKVPSDEPCTKYISTGGNSYRIYTVPADDCVFVIFYPAPENSGFASVNIKENVYAAARHAVSEIIFTADAIAEDGLNTQATEHLNLLESFILDFWGKMSVTEKTDYIISKSEYDFETVNISEKMRDYSAELVKELSDYPIKVTVSSQGGLFARCDFDAVRMLMSDFTGRALAYKNKPESLDISLSCTLENRIAVSVTCRYTDPSVIQGTSNPMDKIRLALAAALNQKCGCSVSEHIFGNTLTLTVDMPECFDQTLIKAPSAHIMFNSARKRFGDINTSLRTHCLNPEYPKRKEK